MITVEQLLESKPDRLLTATPNESVQEALERMVQHTIGSLPVVENNQLVGILSERDYIRKAVPKRVAPWDISVSKIMTNNVITVGRHDTIDTCMDLMCSNSIRHLPVMQDEALIGILSITDVVRALRQESTDVRLRAGSRG